jgi:hypothetical protein
MKSKTLRHRLQAARKPEDNLALLPAAQSVPSGRKAAAGVQQRAPQTEGSGAGGWPCTVELVATRPTHPRPLTKRVSKRRSGTY